MSHHLAASCSLTGRGLALRVLVQDSQVQSLPAVDPMPTNVPDWNCPKQGVRRQEIEG
jgi:hypothetical protein